MKRNKKITILFFLGVIIFILAREIYCMIMYLYNISVKRGDKLFLTKLIDLHNEENALMKDLKEETDEWIKESRHNERVIKAFDGIDLFADIYMQKEKSEKWVVIVHGFGGNGRLMNYAGKVFFLCGYNVIIPDCRGHYKSGGSYIGMGWNDRLDIIRWCDEIKKHSENPKICLYGVSMGGASVMMSSGEKLPYNVKCIIADCGYTSVYEIFKEQLKKLHLPVFPLLNMVSMVCYIKNGFGFKKASAIEAVKKSKIPMLFIHGKNDSFVPCEMVNRLYNAKKGKKEKLIIDGAGHGVSAFIEPIEYWNKVFLFLEKYM